MVHKILYVCGAIAGVLAMIVVPGHKLWEEGLCATVALLCAGKAADPA